MRNREKKGVAGIIAGIFLAAILFSSVFVFFLAVTEGQTTRTKAQLESQEFKDRKLQESIKIRPLDSLNANKVQLGINNTGSIPVAVSYLIVYDDNNIPISVNIGQDVEGLTVNPNTNTIVEYETALPDPSGSTIYRIDLITERGNVLSTTWPPPPEGVPGPPGPPGSVGDVEVVFAQQTGSVILNYTGFGAIYPNWGTVSGVDQRGWKATIKGVPGYPAFRLIDDERPTFLTAVVKNKDLNNSTLTLTHHTGFVLTNNPAGNLQPNPVYICDTNYNTGFVQQYSNSGGQNSPVALPNDNVVIPPPGETNWTKLTFCDANFATNQFWAGTNNGWRPVDGEVNFLFMLLRGNFANGQPYAQTIPYQAVLIPDGKIAGVSLSKYTAPYTNPGSVTVTVSGGNAPFDIHWIYQDGTYRNIGTIASGTMGTFNLPTVKPAPENPGCPVPWDPNIAACWIDWTASDTGFYIIQITDANDRVYFRTFQLT